MKKIVSLKCFNQRQTIACKGSGTSAIPGNIDRYLFEGGQHQPKATITLKFNERKKLVLIN